MIHILGLESLFVQYVGMSVFGINHANGDVLGRGQTSFWHLVLPLMRILSLCLSLSLAQSTI